MGRDPAVAVYYRLTEASRADRRTPVIRVDHRPDGPR
jgi:hypothetical protein